MNGKRVRRLALKRAVEAHNPGDTEDAIVRRAAAFALFLGSDARFGLVKEDKAVPDPIAAEMTGVMSA